MIWGNPGHITLILFASDWFAFAYLQDKKSKGQHQSALRFISSSGKHKRCLCPHLYFNIICVVVLSFLYIK